MKDINTVKRFIYLFILTAIISCTESEIPSVRYEIPSGESDGITIGSAIDAGFDIELLSELVKQNENGTYENMHSILIAKDNALVFEEYFVGKPIYGFTTDWNKNTSHNLHSVTKSFNSALIGIAIDQFGLALDDLVKDYFPELDSSNWEGGKAQITIEHLLTMSSGLKWDEWTYPYDDSRNDQFALQASDNWVHFVLEQPLVFAPGSTFIYNSGLAITLGEIVKRVSGLSIGTFATLHLFRPMGITNVNWSTSSNGIYHTGGGLSLRSRDMLKFGLLFLNKGNWDGEQLISENWIETSTKQQGPNSGYGYQWWLATYQISNKVFNGYTAAGRGGQFIVVLSQLNMVVVFTAGNDNILSTSQPREMMIKYIIPSALNN